MVIDTHSKESLEKSICEYFRIKPENLHSLFEALYNSSTELEIAIADYVSRNMSDTLESVQFYHLSRRLNDSSLNMGNNLYNVLLSKTPVSDFLKNYSIEFKMGADHLLLYHNGKLEELKRASDGNPEYLKWRMGYFKDDEDYCFNGFALRDRLQYNNPYYNSLRLCPEFIYQLALVINKERIIWDYLENSKYYCLEFLVPIDSVIIDGKDYIKTPHGKTRMLLEAALLRLYNYWFYGHYEFDHNNVILRLGDTDTMPEHLFVKAEELS